MPSRRPLAMLFYHAFDKSIHLIQGFVTWKENDDELELRSSAISEMAASAVPQRSQHTVCVLARNIFTLIICALRIVLICSGSLCPRSKVKDFVTFQKVLFRASLY